MMNTFDAILDTEEVIETSVEEEVSQAEEIADANEEVVETLEEGEQIVDAVETLCFFKRSLDKYGMTDQLADFMEHTKFHKVSRVGLESMSTSSAAVAIEEVGGSLWSKFVEWVKDIYHRIVSFLQAFFSGIEKQLTKVETYGSAVDEKIRARNIVMAKDMDTKYPSDIFSKALTYLTKVQAQNIKLFGQDMDTLTSVATHGGRSTGGDFLNNLNKKVSGGKDLYQKVTLKDIDTVLGVGGNFKTTVKAQDVATSGSYYKDTVAAIKIAIKISNTGRSGLKKVEDLVKKNPKGLSQETMAEVKDFIKLGYTNIRNAERCARIITSEYLKRARALTDEGFIGVTASSTRLG